MAASAENISNTSQTKGANKKSALERIVFCIEHLEVCELIRGYVILHHNVLYKIVHL